LFELFFGSSVIKMIKKLSKFGNSHALLIDKPILELLRISEDTLLEISTDGQKLVIKPLRGQSEKMKVPAGVSEEKQ
jgi:antitoxin component of MazEF toxin-antitoxin module